MDKTALVEPELDKPGAGVPAIERLVGKWRVKMSARMGGKAGADAAMEAERVGIRALYEPLSAETSGRRVLIPRLRGLEDSSRYWSVWMVLDHLRIVNEQIAMIISLLGRDRTPEGKASTATVKPAIEVDGSVVGRYEKSCDQVLRAAAGAPSLRSRARYAHPWFGPLSGAEWHTMAGMHMGIHRAQIEAILEYQRVEQS
ncbi:MAG: hypothetical protein U0573_05920 [Phycisphaerales bacterium]|nr:DinB family protein [Planctomycetota bacterium]